MLCSIFAQLSIHIRMRWLATEVTLGAVHMQDQGLPQQVEGMLAPSSGCWQSHGGSAASTPLLLVRPYVAEFLTFRSAHPMECFSSWNLPLQRKAASLRLQAMAGEFSRLKLCTGAGSSSSCLQQLACVSDPGLHHSSASLRSSRSSQATQHHIPYILSQPVADLTMTNLYTPALWQLARHNTISMSQKSVKNSQAVIIKVPNEQATNQRKINEAHPRAASQPAP